jgi:hypothetical protein
LVEPLLLKPAGTLLLEPFEEPVPDEEACLVIRSMAERISSMSADVVSSSVGDDLDPYTSSYTQKPKHDVKQKSESSRFFVVYKIQIYVIHVYSNAS